VEHDFQEELGNDRNCNERMRILYTAEATVDGGPRVHGRLRRPPRLIAVRSRGAKGSGGSQQILTSILVARAFSERAWLFKLGEKSHHSIRPYLPRRLGPIGREQDGTRFESQVDLLRARSRASRGAGRSRPPGCPYSTSSMSTDLDVNYWRGQMNFTNKGY